MTKIWRCTATPYTNMGCSIYPAAIFKGDATQLTFWLQSVLEDYQRENCHQIVLNMTICEPESDPKLAPRLWMIEFPGGLCWRGMDNRGLTIEDAASTITKYGVGLNWAIVPLK